MEQEDGTKCVDFERLSSRKRRGSDDEVDEPNRKHKKLRRSSPNADDSVKEKKPDTNETELSSEIREEESSCKLTSLKEECNEVENYIRLSTGSDDEPEGKHKKMVSSSPDVDNSTNENKKDANEIEAVSQVTEEESTFDLTSVTEESNDAEVSNQISTFEKEIGVSANFKSTSLHDDNENEYLSNNEEEADIVLYERSTEYNFERTESESGASTSSENDEMLRNEYVYRLLRFNEPHNEGLRPKLISSRITLEEHVKNGSKGTCSRFISCCETMNGLNRLIGLTNESSRVREVVRINITKLKDFEDVTIIKLTDENVRKEHIERNSKPWEYAEKFEEVVLAPRSHVPADCVERIGFVQHRTFTKDEHITL